MSVQELLDEYSSLLPNEYIHEQSGVTLLDLESVHFCGHLFGPTMADIISFRDLMEEPGLLARMKETKGESFIEAFRQEAQCAEKKMLLYHQWIYRHWNNQAKKKLHLSLDLKTLERRPAVPCGASPAKSSSAFLEFEETPTGSSGTIAQEEQMPQKSATFNERVEAFFHDGTNRRLVISSREDGDDWSRFLVRLRAAFPEAFIKPQSDHIYARIAAIRKSWLCGEMEISSPISTYVILSVFIASLFILGAVAGLLWHFVGRWMRAKLTGIVARMVGLKVEKDTSCLPSAPERKGFILSRLLYKFVDKLNRSAGITISGVETKLRKLTLLASVEYSLFLLEMFSLLVAFSIITVAG